MSKAKELNNLLTDHNPPKDHTTHIEMLLQLNPKQLFASMLNDGGEHCLEKMLKDLGHKVQKTSVWAPTKSMHDNH